MLWLKQPDHLSVILIKIIIVELDINKENRTQIWLSIISWLVWDGCGYEHQQ